MWYLRQQYSTKTLNYLYYHIQNHKINFAFDIFLRCCFFNSLLRFVSPALGTPSDNNFSAQTGILRYSDQTETCCSPGNKYSLRIK